LLLRSEREEIVAFARRLESDGLAVGTSGNLSVRAGEHVAITPSAVAYDSLTPEAVCVVTLDGAPVEAEAKPSTELPMHLAVYRRRDDPAVVHTHPPFATGLSTVLDELPAVHYLIAMLGGPVRVAPYLTPGSAELADAVVSALEDRFGALLQNHGAISVGSSLAEAYSRARTLEWLCEVYHRARLVGTPRILTDAELRAFAAELQHYGS
jgi:L-fuculose-phosphate aldolase